ncbi:MAG: hypothetical protein V1929_11465 [bacterium]
MKRWFFLSVGVLLALTFPPSASTALARDQGYALIVVPARYSVMQVAFDIVNRHSAVLVSYQGEAVTADPLLHAWNGQEWIRITLSDYRDVNFLQQTPNRTVLVGDDQTLPASLSEASSWSPQVVCFTDLDTAALVNEFGKLFSFTEQDWKWFAARYNLDLQDENAPLRSRSWYDQPGPLKRDGKGMHVEAPQAVDDIQPAPVYEVLPDADRPAVE